MDEIHDYERAEFATANARGGQAYLDRQSKKTSEPSPPIVAEINEKIGSMHIRISTSELYTTVQINDLHLFFIRETGKYDGYSREEKG